MDPPTSDLDRYSVGVRALVTAKLKVKTAPRSRKHLNAFDLFEHHFTQDVAAPETGALRTVAVPATAMYDGLQTS